MGFSSRVIRAEDKPDARRWFNAAQSEGILQHALLLTAMDALDMG